MAEKTGKKTETTQEPPLKTPEEGCCCGSCGNPEGGETQDAREAKIAELETAKKTLEEEVLSLKDQNLRTRADTDNFRKRLLKEKQESIQAANKQLLEDLLPVLDDFERATKSAEESRDFTAFHDGVIMIEKQLVDLLDRKWGLRRFCSQGEEFDPQRHEALSCEQRPGGETSRVLEDYRTGYTLHDKVFRSAKVKISMPAAETHANENAGTQPQESAQKAD